jgi:CheY-like chemotaxis protein
VTRRLRTYDEIVCGSPGGRPFVYSRGSLRLSWIATVRQNCMCMKDKSNLVLCVDDELVGLKVRKIVLERAGYRVLTAPDGPAGLAIFSDQPVEAVILDYSMPGMHGGEVARRMRETKPEIPILLLSAYIGLSAEVTSLVDLHMTKGEGAPVLLEKLGSLLQPTSA